MGEQILFVLGVWEFILGQCSVMNILAPKIIALQLSPQNKIASFSEMVFIILKKMLVAYGCCIPK